MRLFLIIFLFLTNSALAQTSVLRSGWKFAAGTHLNAQATDFNDAAWPSVTVPHDWAITGPSIPNGDGNTGKLPWKGEGWYRRTLEIPNAFAGKTLYLLFDGIMAFPEVYVNGKPAGSWDYGYNSFYIDISGLVQPGKANVLAVHVDTRNHDSRWYPGAGIYRKVSLIIVDPLHVGLWGTHVTTPIVKPHYADVRIATTIVNARTTPDSVRVLWEIVSPSGLVVVTQSKKLLAAAGSTETEVTLTLPNPRRWDIVDPALYQLRTTLFRGAAQTDQALTSFGVRTMRFTADHGFYLNDRRVQLKGVNLHHDHGPLGAAFYPRAMERQLEIMKSMGANAVRTSHNAPAPELLELCDKMGILVFNELFDKYDAKADLRPGADFGEFAHRNVRNWMLRDRNHPSIFLWSVGNEIGDVQYNVNGGFNKLQTMVNYVRRYDPTRPVTLVCDNQASAALRHFDYYDVHAWNYGRRYALARQLEPNKSVIISESASTVSTRGFYELPLPAAKTDFTKSLQVSSYDLNAPEWAEIADDDFMWQQDEDYVAGEFVWTGFDYLGEPTPYGNAEVKKMGFSDREAARGSYFGIVDMCGIPKDRYYLYKSYWKPEETTVHILPHWNWPSKTEKVPVMVYTNGDCAELFLNGQSLGMRCKKPKSPKSTERFRLVWDDVTYKPGELEAVAYREGRKIGEQTVRTAGEPFALRLTADRTTMKSDGADLAYVLVEAIDKNGNPCPLANNTIDVSILGPAKIAGVGNGDPQSLDSFQDKKVKLFHGKAMVILAGTGAAGEVKVSVSSGSLAKGVALVKITN
jgi:beta-galactosidase